MNNLGTCTIYPERPTYCRVYPLFPGYLSRENTLIIDVFNCPGVSEIEREHSIYVGSEYIEKVFREIQYLNEYLMIIPQIPNYVPLDSDLNLWCHILDRWTLLRKLAEIIKAKRQELMSTLLDLLSLPLILFNIMLNVISKYYRSKVLELTTLLHYIDEKLDRTEDVDVKKLSFLLSLTYNTLLKPYYYGYVVKLPDVFHRRFITSRTLVGKVTLDRLRNVQLSNSAINTLLNYLEEVLSRIPTYFTIVKLPLPYYVLSVTLPITLIAVHYILYHASRKWETTLENTVKYSIWVNDVLTTGLLAERAKYYIPHLLSQSFLHKNLNI